MTYNFVVSAWYGVQGMLFLLGSYCGNKICNHYQNKSQCKNKDKDKDIDNKFLVKT